MPLKFPKITVVTASFNQGKYLEDTILSVLGQQYPNLEYIIIDGGSSDNTVDILRKYEKHLTYWVSENDTGQSHALNKGFQRATGDIIGWINSDDWYEAGTFEIVRQVFTDPSIEVIAGNCRMVYEGGPQNNFIDRPGDINFLRLTRYWQHFFCPPQPAVFFRKQVLEKTGKLDETLNYGMDLDFWLRISKNYQFHYVDELFANYLVHDASKSGRSNGFETFMPEWEKVVEKHMAEASILEKLKFWWERRNHKKIFKPINNIES